MVLAAPAWAEAPRTAMTLEGYVKRAVEQGVQAKINELTLQAAGYTREIALRSEEHTSELQSQR